MTNSDESFQIVCLSKYFFLHRSIFCLGKACGQAHSFKLLFNYSIRLGVSDKKGRYWREFVWVLSLLSTNRCVFIISLSSIFLYVYLKAKFSSLSDLLIPANIHCGDCVDVVRQMQFADCCSVVSSLLASQCNYLYGGGELD